MKKFNLHRIAALLAILTVLSFIVSCAAETTAGITDTEAAAPSDTAGVTTGEETTLAPETTLPETTEPVTTEPVTTEPETTEPVTTEPETTEPETTEPETTEPETTEPETTAPETTEPPVTEPVIPHTASPTKVMCKNGFIFAIVEDGADVRVYNRNQTLLYEAKAGGPVFIGPAPITGTLIIKAQVDGKRESVGATVNSTSTAANFSTGNDWGGLNSTMFFYGTREFYLGNVAAPSAEHMNGVKNHLESQLEIIRGRTGKDTKLIIISVTNPATIYYNEQLNNPVGPGKINAVTPTSVFTEFMKGHEDIYVVDARKVLTEHKDEIIFHQTDTHYTELGAYWCYREMMDEYVLNDFPEAIVHPLSDYNVDYVLGDKGDLTGIAGVNEFYEYTPYLNPKFDQSLVGSIHAVKRAHSKVGISVRTYPVYSSIDAPKNPTAYLIGDSYTANFALFASQAFSELYINQDLMSVFQLDDLETKKPDYIVFVCTERNVGTDLAYIWAHLTQ